ncbi:MAG: fructoselysine 6-kinase [Pleomorphochaeta sp.]
MRLATIGSNCIDFYSNYENGKAFPGGGPVNMAVYATRIGEKASYIGIVGSDEYGELMIKAISDKGVDISHLHSVPGKTAVTQVQLIDGERVFGDYDEGVLENYKLSESDINFICDNHDIVICDLWGKVEGYFKTLKSKGIKTAFDCATRPGDKECSIAIPYTDYLFFSSDDGDTDTLREFMKALHSQGPQLVISMLGEKGSLCFDGNTFYKFGIVDCDEFVDSMGAGDSYIAGFLSGISKGLSIEECMRIGASTASETLKYFGAW